MTRKDLEQIVHSPHFNIKKLVEYLQCCNYVQLLNEQEDSKEQRFDTFVFLVCSIPDRFAHYQLDELYPEAYFSKLVRDIVPELKRNAAKVVIVLERISKLGYVDIAARAIIDLHLVETLSTTILWKSLPATLAVKLFPVLLIHAMKLPSDSAPDSRDILSSLMPINVIETIQSLKQFFSCKVFIDLSMDPPTSLLFLRYTRQSESLFDWTIRSLGKLSSDPCFVSTANSAVFKRTLNCYFTDFLYLTLLGICAALMLSLKLLNDEQITFLKGVVQQSLSDYMSSSQPTLRIPMMVLAEELSAISDKECNLLFELDELDPLVRSHRALCRQEFISLSGSPSVNIEHKQTRLPEKNVQGGACQSETSDSESDLESFRIPQERMKNRDFDTMERISSPKYLKQALAYLKSAESDTRYQKVDVAISVLPSLIKESSEYEVVDLWSSLLPALLNITNTYDMPHFDESITLSVVSLVQRVPIPTVAYVHSLNILLIIILVT